MLTHNSSRSLIKDECWSPTIKIKDLTLALKSDLKTAAYMVGEDEAFGPLNLGLSTRRHRKMGENSGSHQQTGRNWMGCMSAYCVLVAVLHVLPIGGTQKSFLDQLHCYMLIDGYLTVVTIFGRRDCKQ